MTLDDFDFDLPERLIALRPVKPRPASRMLLAQGDAIADRHVRDLAEILRPGDLLVFNDTRVLPARLRGVRKRDSAHGSGEARIEVTLATARPDGTWTVLAKPAKRLAAGDEIRFDGSLSAEVLDREGGEVHLRFDAEGDAFDAALQRLGEMPLPPYIAGKRAADAQDLEDYQTVFARVPGAVAAPTASLHFDEDLLERLKAAGVGSTHVTLHVGAGTFLPVTVDNIANHKMHAEWGEVTEAAAQAIAEARAKGGRVIPVGTTALRLIESAARETGAIAPFRGETDIFIRPGFEFRVADGLMTNFHLPRSTLMMLVSALMGVERIRAIYSHAITNDYRFFSYGDSSLLLPEG
ncbi:tRNA preQ1(34) S-adenosylmethionine ribosyltransferase-isomerase QueA [Halovulum sp. GXIMD14794]